MSEHGIEGEKRFRLSMTPEEAARERKRLLADPKIREAYLDKTHIEHDEVLARISALHVAEVGDEVIG